MTVQVNHMINTNESSKYLEHLSLKNIDLNKNGSFRLNLLTKNKEYYFKNCFFSNTNSFESCPTLYEFDFKNFPFYSMLDLTLNNEKGFYFESLNYAFFHQNLKVNVFNLESNGYSENGNPESIFLSVDAKYRIIIFQNKYESEIQICHREKYDLTSATYQFQYECNSKKIPENFKPMKKVFLKNTLFIRIGGHYNDESLSKNEVYILYREGPVIWKRFYRYGFSKELPVNLYYLLLPPAILFDILTYPLQTLIGKNLFPTP